jgi:(p)ppGpp synthase/HD superfamily hydrolase
MTRPTINETIMLVCDLHADQVDKLGAPYYFHPLRVMMRLGPDADVVEKHAALLHDVLEDVAGATADTLREHGYPETVIRLCQLLCRGQDETYPSFIERIISSRSRSAMRIKLADLYDNTNEERALGASDAVRRQLADMTEKKYRPAIARLKLALGPRTTTVIAGPISESITDMLNRE